MANGHSKGDMTDAQMERTRPRSDYVIVKRDENPKRVGDLGLLHAPTSSHTRVQTGVVHACGPGREAKDGSRLPMGVRVGDRVLFDRQQDHGEERRFLVLREPAIMAVLT